MSFANAFALVIGIGQYMHIRSLAKPANDAQSIHQVLTDPALCGYPPDNVKLLVDDQATQKAIRDELKWLAANAEAESTSIIFFSGHGGQNPTDPMTGNYLLPHDCDPLDHGTLSVEKLSRTSISSDEFTKAIRAIDSQKLVVIFDCCHSGGVGDVSRDPFSFPAQMRSGLSEDYYAVLAQGKGRVIMASCLGNEKSWERTDMHNGIFTTHLLAALRGRAAVREDGLIHILDVFHDLHLRVPPDVAACYDPDTHGPAQQHPFLKAATQDNFAVALHQGGARSIYQVSNGMHLKTQPISNIRSDIVDSPIKGVGTLIEYLADKPGWNSERQALGLRLAILKQAKEQEHSIGMITPGLEAERRLAIHFALSVCWDIEDKIRSGQAV
jgi:hypothetical protein